jgi:hypothetical protein
MMERDEELRLQRALEKLVLYGEQVGVSPEEMIQLLESRMSVTQLLRYLSSKAGAA